jgi:hypothetical protein
MIFKFTIHGSVHRNNILIQKSQQDAHGNRYTVLFSVAIVEELELSTQQL